MSRPSCLLLLAIFSVLLVPARLSAQESLEPTAISRPSSPPQLVTARPLPDEGTPLPRVPGQVTVITADEIAGSHAQSVPELLSTYESVTVMDTQGFGAGADTSVNLRGFGGGSRTSALVLLDGVRQNRLTGDEVHWSAIPLEQVERIEIIRGGSALAYGEGALSGVINIITKRLAKRPVEAEGGAEIGGFGRRKAFTSARGASGVWRYGLGVHRDEAAGYRESSSSRAATVTGHAGVDLTDRWRFDLTAHHSEDTTRFPGGITSEASQERRRQQGSFHGFLDNRYTQARVETLWEGDGVGLAADAYAALRESDSVVSDSRFATATPTRGASARGWHRRQLSAQATHQFVGGLDLIDEKASTGLTTGGYSESNKSGYGLYVEETLRFFDRASLIAGARYDQTRFQEAITFPVFEGTLRFQGWSPRLALTVDVARSLTMFASVARPFKAPNVDDFSAVLPGFIGNVDMGPQQATTYETGVDLDAPVGRSQATVFYSRTDDEILYNDAAFQNQNFDTERLGVELSVEPRLPWPQLSSRFTYTFLESEFLRGPFADNSLPAAPEHTAGWVLHYAPVEPLTLTARGRLVHDFYRINDFRNALPGNAYGVLDLGLRYLYHTATLYFTVENVTDEEYTSFQSSSLGALSSGENPAPPRSYVAGVTVRF